MKKRTFLFFPIEIGLAHITRALAIAEELQARGNNVYFALPKRKHQIFAKTNVTLVDIPSHFEHDEDLLVKSLSNYALLRRHTDADLELVRKYRPDAVVIDYRLSALAAARIEGIKAVFITNGSILPCGSVFPTHGFPRPLYRFLGPAAGLIFTKGMRLFLRNLVRIVEEHGVPTDIEEWFRSVPYIIPEPVGYFPPRKNELTLLHTGPLAWKGFEIEPPAWLKKISPDGRTLYITFGGTGFNKNRLIELSVALEEQGYRVIVTTGSLCNPEDFPKKNNLYPAKFLPGNEVCRRVDAVICHGGYGTLMEAIVAEKPVVAVPFNPDQINHAARIQDLGLGRSMFHLAFGDIFNIFSFRWHKIELKSRNIPLRDIISGVEDIMKHRSHYEKNYRRFHATYPLIRDGEKKAALFIENFADGKKG